MARYTFVGGGSSKFWEGSVAGSVLTVKFGRIGTAGQTKDKDLGSAEAAAKELDKLVREKLREGYVEEAAAGETASAAGETASAAGRTAAPSAGAGGGGSKPAPVVGDGKYPFLFYGAHPGDWAGFIYAFRFVTAPGADTRLAIAEAWEKSARKTTVDTEGDNWRWSGNWGLASLDAKGSDWDRFYAQLESCLRAVHAVAPLAEVIDCAATTLSDSDEWTSWTLAIQPLPSPQPAWKGLTPISCWRERWDPQLGEGGTDFDFEQARQEVRKYGKASQPSPKGALEVREIESWGAPLPPMVPREVEKLFPERSWVQGHDAARVAATFGGTLLYLDRNGKPAPVTDHGYAAAYRGIALSPDGARAAVLWYPDTDEASERTCICELSLPDGGFREILCFPGRLNLWFDYLDADRLAIRVRDRIVIAGLDGKRHAWTRPIDGASLVRSALDGRLLFVTVEKPGVKSVTRVLRADGDVLSEICDLPVTFAEVWAADGRLIAGDPEQASVSNRFVEILHADDVLASPPAAGSTLMDEPDAMKVLDEPDPAGGSTADKPETPTPGQLDLVRVRRKWEVLPEPVPEALTDKFGETRWLATRAGRYAGVTKDWKLLYTDAEGEVRTAEVEGDPRAPYIDPDGKHAIFTGTFTDAVRVYELNLDDGTCRQLRQWDFRDYGARVVGVGEGMMAAVASVWLLLESRAENEQYANVKFKAPSGQLAGGLFAARDGRLLVVKAADWEYQVFRVDGRKLKKIGPLAGSFTHLWERDGRVYVGDLPWGYVYEMTGINEVLE
jgi:predicted DNA-binding WGR domain protein